MTKSATRILSVVLIDANNNGSNGKNGKFILKIYFAG